MKINKITVGRLYNLGNYEHVRYELTVEVPEGESAAAAIVGIEKILQGLQPIKQLCIKDACDLKRMANQIEEMKKMPFVEWSRQYGHCKGTPEEVIQRYQDTLNEETQKHQAAMERARKARAMFDNLGGCAEWKDAKLDWQDDFDDDWN